ncbi:MAG: head GIN domain-containing protein [Bacteroidota bacterium]
MQLRFNNYTLYFISFIFFPFFLFSCNKENCWDCIKRAGKVTTEVRVVPPFTKLKIRDNVNVFITQGNSQEIKVEAGKNLISLVSTKVSNDELLIQNNNKCNWSRSYKNNLNVYVTVTQLTHIYFDGSGQIKSTNTIVGNSLDVLTNTAGDVELTIDMHSVISHLHSSADITLHGKSDYHGIFHGGEGFLKCEDLQTFTTWTMVRGTGNEYLNVKNQLVAFLEWTGDIYYSGNPVVDSKISGSGKLIHQN